MSECKRFLNVFVSVFVTLIGVILIGLVAGGYAKLDTAKTSLQNLAAVNYYATAIFVAVILLVILLTFGGLCGVAGSLKKNPYCMLFYAIISIICAVWFLAVSLAALKGPDAYFSGNCTSVEYFDKLNNYTLAGSDPATGTVCTTGCTCYMDANVASTYTTSQNTSYLTAVVTTDGGEAVNNQLCPSSSWNTAPLDLAETAMNYMETFLGCTNWCNDSSRPLLIYRWSNVSMGRPGNYCYDVIKTNVLAYSQTGYIIGFIMTGITALAFILGCYLRKDFMDPQNQVKQESPSQMRLQY